MIPGKYRDAMKTAVPDGLIPGGMDRTKPFTVPETVAAFLELVAADRVPVATQPDTEEAVWMITPVGGDEYAFEFLPLGAAGQVRIYRVDGSYPPVVVPGPVGYLNGFKQHLAAGAYEISWHWMEGQTDIRVRAGFPVPFQAPHFVVKR